MFQKRQVDTILPFGDIPILSIYCTIQGLNTHIHHLTHPNTTNIHTLYLHLHFTPLPDIYKQFKGYLSVIYGRV